MLSWWWFIKLALSAEDISSSQCILCVSNVTQLRKLQDYPERVSSFILGTALRIVPASCWQQWKTSSRSRLPRCERWWSGAPYKARLKTVFEDETSNSVPWQKKLLWCIRWLQWHRERHTTTLDPELNSSSTQRSTQPSAAYLSSHSDVLILLMLPFDLLGSPDETLLLLSTCNKCLII